MPAARAVHLAAPGPLRRCLAAALLVGAAALPAVPVRGQCSGFSGEAKLTAADAEATDRFGHSVAASGDTVVVGAFRDAELGIFAGSAWVGVTVGGTWQEQARLFASDGEAFDNFGARVAIDGDTIVVGVPGDDDVASAAGAAFVFVRSGDTWSEQVKLTADDGRESAELGAAVAIDRDTIVVGAPFDLVAGQNRGSAYVFVREAGTWRQQGKLTTTAVVGAANFGIAVAVSGDVALVGAPDDNDASFSSGSAHAFVRTGETWTLEAELRAADETTGDTFGQAVALSGDVALVGAFGDDDNGDNSGSAYAFVRDGGAWTEGAKLRASDGAVGDQFGRSVALFGDLALVGARSNDEAASNAGAAYLFQGDGVSFAQQAKLLASDAEALDQFGGSVGLSGRLGVVGAEDDDDAGSGSGSAHVFCFAAAEADCTDGTDDDGDGLVDCDDPDCQPSPVQRVDVARDAASDDTVLVSWSPSPEAASWDVASDLLSVLHAAGEAAGPCVARDLPATEWSDDRAVSDDGYYYLVRAGPCPSPTGWGSDSRGRPRPACP